MSKKKVMLVFGASPEVIKMCPLVNELKSHPGKFASVMRTEALASGLPTFVSEGVAAEVSPLSGASTSPTARPHGRCRCSPSLLWAASAASAM